jgi:hypothetical protein
MDSILWQGMGKMCSGQKRRWFVSKNMLKIKIIELARSSLTVLKVWGKSLWLFHKMPNKFSQPINDG